MTERSIIKLLRSGNFTLIGQDSDRIDLHKGHINYGEIIDEDGDVNSEEVEYEDIEVGYIPGIVVLLVKALGGNVDSI